VFLRVPDPAAVTAAAALLAIALAAPVLRAPSERVFGLDTVGRHHDPFTVMQRFSAPIRMSVSAQPVTDVAGAVAARLVGPVAAYNVMVLVTFPLAALFAFLLARHVGLSSWGAAVAAIAYAFSPFHLAQAAYHPHIAQIQWLPLYLLALWRCVDSPTPVRMTVLGLATAAVTLSNFYGGFIAAVITPIALGAYWWVARAEAPAATRRLAMTTATLAAISAAGFIYVWVTARAVLSAPAAFGFPRADLFRYSAKWWAYLVPPVAQPWLGHRAREFWATAGIREGLLEQQVSLGWAIVALAAVAALAWMATRPHRSRPRALARVPMLMVIAFAALLCSLSPERTIGTVTFVRPSAFFYTVAPMFRAYARFGVVVQLMAAILAGIAVDWLVRSGRRPLRLAAAVLVTVAAAEYAVSPFALWRDALPTAAHRWIADRAGPARALDCAALTQESASVGWLSNGRIALLGGAIADCAEPDLADKLAANGYSHLIVRRGIPESLWFDDRALPAGLAPAARLPSGRVFAVTAPVPEIYTSGMSGFFAREYLGKRSWRWMGNDGEWTVVVTGEGWIAATLCIEAEAFGGTRTLQLRLDGRSVQSLTIGPGPQDYRIALPAVAPGAHHLLFHAVEPPAAVPAVGSHRDPRRLSFAIGPWTWALRGDRS
jgi:hypothetical protein